MFGPGLLLLGALAIALPALLVCLILWVISQASSDDGGAPARAARRHELLVSGLAFLAATVAAIALIAQPVRWPGWAPAPGAVQALTPFAVAAVFAMVRSAGELTWPRPRGAVRAAPLARRTPWSVGGSRLRWVLGTAAALTLVLVAAGFTANETGRQFSSAPVNLPEGVLSSSSGPYPGWTYGVPMLLGLAATLAVTWVALSVITRRAPLHGLPAVHDAAVRRTSAGRLLAVVQLCLGGALGGVTIAAGSAVMSAGQNLYLNGADPGAYIRIGQAVGTAGLVVVVASVVAALVAVWPRRAPRADLVTAAGAVA